MSDIYSQMTTPGDYWRWGLNYEALGKKQTNKQKTFHKVTPFIWMKTAKWEVWKSFQFKDSS